MATAFVQHPTQALSTNRQKDTLDVPTVLSDSLKYYVMERCSIR